MKKRTRNLLIGIIAAITLVTATCAGGIYYLLFAPQFHPDRTVYVYIDRDDTADSIYNKVYRQGKAKCFQGFLWMAAYRDYPQHIHTGRYAIRPGENVYHVFSRLCRGYQEPTNLTIGSVRTLDRLARNVGRQLMIDSLEVISLLTDTLFLQQMGYTEATLPALFIPDTYQVYWDMSAKGFMERMAQEHRKFWNEERLRKTQAIGLTPIEVSTLASIVEEETNDRDEKPLVAGLYLNRLRIGMPLQADPTVKFAQQDFALRRITNAHLTVDSPYNTYRHPGLPPGPIRIPTPVGLDAVLNPAEHNYLYMCAKEDFSGTHNFAATLAEHNKNARRYWNALNKRKIYK
ncbi:MAG: endolytic transglycosylase MltG [Bacteroides sp.]|nr:endolytic transglycosylase MltG [Bacteroides sp.]